MAEVSTNSTIPENQFRPNATLDALEPAPGEERVQHDEEDNAGGANLDEGFDDFRNPEGPTRHETDQITGVDAARQEMEAEARDSGWVTKAEWMGNHNGSAMGWRDADHYLAVRRTVLPVVQKENSTLRAKVAALEAKDRAREAAERDRAARIEANTATAELREAAEAGDWDRHAAIVKKLASQPAPAAAPAGDSVQETVKTEFLEFVKVNPWLKTNKQASRTFAQQLRLITDTKTADSFEDAFEQAKAEVMRRHPEQFRRAPARSMAETGGDSTGIGGGKNQTWANLKPEYRQQAEADVRAGHYTKAQYLENCTAEYFRT